METTEWLKRWMDSVHQTQMPSPWQYDDRQFVSKAFYDIAFLGEKQKTSVSIKTALLWMVFSQFYMNSRKTSSTCIFSCSHVTYLSIYFVIEDGPRSKRSRLDDEDDGGGDGDYHRSDPQIAICLDCLRNSSLVGENVVKVSHGGEVSLPCCSVLFFFCSLFPVSLTLFLPLFLGWCPFNYVLLTV